MKKYIILLFSLAALTVACGDDELKEIGEQIDHSLVHLDSIQIVLDSWYPAEFAADDSLIAITKSNLDELEEGSDEYKAATKVYMSELKDLEERKTEFLNARKGEIKKVYAKANDIIVNLDGLIAELDKTKKDPMVTTYTVEDTLFKDYFKVKGNVEAKGNALIVPEMAGTVKSISATKGEMIKKDALIMTLDTDVLDKQLLELETSLTLATDLYNRQKSLWDQNIGSEVQLLEAENRKNALENTKATLNAQRKMAQIKAPFSGMLDEIVPKVGEMAAPGMPVARVVNLDELFIEADVSERHFGTIEVGGQALVSVQGMDDVQDVPATITRVGSYIKPDNRTFQIRVDFGDDAPALIPNLVADLKINEFTMDSVCYLPYSMIEIDAMGNSYVWSLTPSEKAGKATVEKTIIEVGPTYENITCVFSGLEPGSVIVDKGAKKMRKGITVRLQETEQKVLASK